MSHALGSDAAATAARRDEITALLAAGGLEACRDLVLDEVGTGPHGVRWCTDLTSSLVDAGDLRAASALADLLARVRWGSTRRPARRANGRALTPPATTPRHRVSATKLRHDADQFALLRRRGLLGTEFDTVIADYRAIADRLGHHDESALVDLGGDDARRIAHVYNRIVHVADAPRVARALSDGWDAGAVEDEFLDSPPGVVVVDDVLTPPAWDGLLRFCQESTVWSGDPGVDGRLESTFLDGFTCHLLMQIAEELREQFPRVVGRRPLEQLSAVKDSHHRLAAAPRHSHATPVSVTFWITPSTANLAPDTGGVVVLGPRPRTVPYRGNRAVLLGPDVVHTSDVVEFAPGYEHRRIAVTFDYGEPPA